jgi:hypothetical protein
MPQFTHDDNPPIRAIRIMAAAVHNLIMMKVVSVDADLGGRLSI